MKVFEAFAGMGGGSFALKRLKAKHPSFNYELVGYSEIDKFAIKIFEANHCKEKEIKNYGDIAALIPEELPDFDMFMGGFPCQPFSVAGLMQGSEDIKGRGTMLQHILQILEIKKPKYVLLENVKGFLYSKFKDTRELLAKELRRIGYSVEDEVFFRGGLMNSSDYGVPQKRERVWMFAVKGELPENFTVKPEKVIGGNRLKDLVDSVEDIPEKMFLTQSQIDRLKERLNINSFKVEEPLCLDIYCEKIKFDGICSTLSDPIHNTTRLLECRRGKEEVRKLTIPEIFRLMGFKDGEINFSDLSYTQLARRAGNGWDVNLVTLILENVFKQLSII